MKLFIYKSLFVSLLIFLIFHATFGFVLRKYEAKIYNLLSKDNLIFLKEKAKQEIKNSIKKDRILNKEDSALIKNFLNKINSELNSIK